MNSNVCFLVRVHTSVICPSQERLASARMGYLSGDAPVPSFDHPAMGECC